MAGECRVSCNHQSRMSTSIMWFPSKDLPYVGGISLAQVSAGQYENTGVQKPCYRHVIYLGSLRGRKRSTVCEVCGSTSKWTLRNVFMIW